MVFPDNTLIAGIDVKAAINNTKMKLSFALIECGSNGIEITPANSKKKDKKRNKESVIYIRWSNYYFIRGALK